MSLITSQSIKIEVTSGDILTFKADVLALKYACSFHGVDSVVAKLFSAAGINISRQMPVVGAAHVMSTHGRLGAASLLFAGVVPLRQFGYEEIRGFGKQVMGALAKELPGVRHLCLTLHGAGFGLDEIEAFESEVAGIREALESGIALPLLERITFVERREGRAERMQETLQRMLPGGVLVIGPAETDEAKALEQSKEIVPVTPPAKKPHIFVAMPFLEEMDDIYHYGIQKVVREAGYICERVDGSCYTGDIVARVKELIEGAAVVVADLSHSNPNVYLEVGYAWGCKKPTILLVNDLNELKFDVQGQKCLIYKKIRDLEQLLAQELERLSPSL